MAGLPICATLIGHEAMLGVRSDFAAAWKVILASQAGLAIILLSMAPLTAFWYVSSADYRLAILFNALVGHLR